MDCGALLEEIDRRCGQLCRRIADGEDAPPGQLLRLEGLREAALLAGLASAAELQDRLEAIYLRECGEAIAVRCGEGWRDTYPFPEIPLFMARAPVSTGGGD